MRTTRTTKSIERRAFAGIRPRIPFTEPERQEPRDLERVVSNYMAHPLEGRDDNPVKSASHALEPAVAIRRFSLLNRE
jgi:hypothetical protein